MKRFRGAITAVLVVIGLLIFRSSVGVPEQEAAPLENTPTTLFSFEKSDLVGISIVRPDNTLNLTQRSGEWVMNDYTWRPSRTMARRIGHQIHALTARATITDAADDLSLYGLGGDAITVTLTLKGGEAIRFRVGDPNPTSVSYYVQPLPETIVYTVQKAAMDYYREPIRAFREPRFSWFNAADANQISVRIGRDHWRFSRVGVKSWQMTAPVVQAANREKVRQILGRTGALKAVDYLADDISVEDIGEYGLETPHAIVKISLTTGEVITLAVSTPVSESGQMMANVYRHEDRAVYRAKVGFLDTLDGTISSFRDPIILTGQPTLSVVTIQRPETVDITISRGVDGWTWDDGTPIPGSTPRRAAAAIKDLRAINFLDSTPIDAPTMTLDVMTVGGHSHRLILGATESTEAADGSLVVTQPVYVDGDGRSYDVSQSLSQVLEDVRREHDRHKARVNERRQGNQLPATAR